MENIYLLQHSQALVPGGTRHVEMLVQCCQNITFFKLN